MAKLLLLTLLVACNAELILDGGENGWSQWYRSVDGVMGGRSSISLQRDGNVLAATGEIVTAGGGFAGMYTRLDDVDASKYAGLRVTYEALPAGQTPLASGARSGRAAPAWIPRTPRPRRRRPARKWRSRSKLFEGCRFVSRSL